MAWIKLSIKEVPELECKIFIRNDRSVESVQLKSKDYTENKMEQFQYFQSLMDGHGITWTWMTAIQMLDYFKNSILLPGPLLLNDIWYFVLKEGIQWIGSNENERRKV